MSLQKPILLIIHCEELCLSIMPCKKVKIQYKVQNTNAVEYYHVCNLPAFQFQSTFVYSLLAKNFTCGNFIFLSGGPLDTSQINSDRMSSKVFHMSDNQEGQHNHKWKNMFGRLRNCRGPKRRKKQVVYKIIQNDKQCEFPFISHIVNDT